MFLWQRITGRLAALRLGLQGGTSCACLQARVLEKLMTITKALRLASVVTAMNVLVASGFSIVGIIRPQYLLPAGFVPTQASLILAMYAAARTIPLALFALGAIYKQATPALLLLGAVAGAMQLLMPESACSSTILGNALGRSLSLSSNSSWCICFTDHAANQARIGSVPDVVPVAPDCRREFWEPYSTRTN
jgi:hypothetical protein